MNRQRFDRLAIIGPLVLAAFTPVSARAQTPLTVLQSFNNAPNSLIQTPDGNFYGMSGSFPSSVFFRMTPAGTVTVLRTFTGEEGGGTLTLGADGNFYGVTRAIFDPFAFASENDIFRLTPSGNLTLLAKGGGIHQLTVQGSDGYLYGSYTYQSCHFACDLHSGVFRISTTGEEKVLLGFGLFPPITPSISAEASDGSFYGTLDSGVSGVIPSRIVRMTPAGAATDVYSFTGRDDGHSGLVRFQAADGNLYGLTASGGANRIGAVFRLTPGGTFSILHSFTGGTADGAAPSALVEATDGNFYGTTTQGGPANLGTVFQLTPTGAFTLLHAFDASEGTPQSFLQGIDGSFYGTTEKTAWRLRGPDSRPDAPTGLTVRTPLSGLPRVSLTWTETAGASSYTVKRGTSPGSEIPIATGVKFLRWIDVVNVTGTRFYYTVSAVNGHGESGNSNEVTALVPARPADFNGDSKTDLLVYRPSEGAWFNRETGLVSLLGEAGDVPVPGDYDGDGKNDLAVFRASTGSWLIVPTSTGIQKTVAFGGATDVPVPGDYDGDGTFDLAVYRPSTGVWFIRQSSTNAVVTRALGVGADVPVPADYDGDGIIDVAVYRPVMGMWYIRKSSTGGATSLAFQWGLQGDVPVPGDYDGDGQSDIAVYRPSSGGWYVRQSSTGTLVTIHLDFGGTSAPVLGNATDLTVPADYDGDGKIELGVYRPSTGTWYFMRLESFISPEHINWGLPGDVPAVNASIRNAVTVMSLTRPVSTVANTIRAGDFDVDGRVDLTVYRPSTGVWFTLLSQGGYSASTAIGFGAAIDTPVPGDYDGDGKTDLALYTTSTGMWTIALSSSGVVSYQWGLSGDVPVPADFDGDGRTDLAVFRPADGTWNIRLSSTNFTTSSATPWGLPGDVAVAGDYDGDGITDLAVYRPPAGMWYILQSSTNFATYTVIQWGLPGDVAVPGDYDGDGHSDLAVFRPANGTWYVLKSSSGFTTHSEIQWGLPGDVPVPGDYDGDGGTDAAVYRPATGEWYFLSSASGFTAWSVHHWGLPDDVPVFKRP